MGAKRLTVVPVKEYPVERVSLNAIEVLPERFQTRAQTDPEVVHTYAEWISKGTDMGCVILVHTADDRWILADGFHRYEAHVKLKLRSIKAQIREGTETDAILVGVEQNGALEKIRGLTVEDRRHAVELMIRNDETRAWPDGEIARRCRISESSVKNVRLDIHRIYGIPLPDRVVEFCDGLPTAKWRKSRKYQSHTSNKRPTVINVDAGSIRVNEDANSRQSNSGAPVNNQTKFMTWLSRRNVGCSSCGGPMGGIAIRGTLLFLVENPDFDGLLRGVGCAVLVRQRSAAGLRTVLVGYRDGYQGVSEVVLKSASKLSPPIEFMTPDELVAEFGPKSDEPSPTTPDQPPED
jgi:hypothetical protein